MLYRVHVAVLLANPSGPEAIQMDWPEAVAHTFGINAPDASEAVRMAVAAAETCVDRQGDYIGGIVVETACRCVDEAEFTGYESYFHQPIHHTGIFYVSGTCGYRLPGSLIQDALTQLDVLRAQIGECGPPMPNFIKPQLPDSPPERMRLLCSICKRWLEVDSEELMHLVMKGMSSFTIEDQKIWRSINVIGPFLLRHMEQCMFVPNGPRGMIRAIHKPDPLWDKLDPDKEEGFDQPNAGLL